jgi:pyridoxamine 5'-phosphate oxidase
VIAVPLDERDFDPDPMVQFDRWYREAFRAGLERPDAMALATVGPDGNPSVRIVLLKGADPDGFVFYTNYESHKARDLARNPHAALVFHWPELHRQVRVSATVSPISRQESERYFATRPREARLAAWASRQSETIQSRGELEERFRQLEAEYEGREIPLPPYWGGFRLRPESIEFWQGHAHRLHDRLRYRREPVGGWVLERLSP